jgi:hypothetical protein
MTTVQTKRLISGIVSYGIDCIKSGKLKLDSVITSDRLLIEMTGDDTIIKDINQITKIYYQYEDHIHDVIEALIHLEKNNKGV